MSLIENWLLLVGSVQVSSLAPAQYDLGVAVGWKRFAVSGDVGRTSSPDPVIGTRETAIVGVSYNLKKFTGRVAVGGERNDSRIANLSRPDSMSVDLGGSYNISRNIALTGGVRYKVERDEIPALAEEDSTLLSSCVMAPRRRLRGRARSPVASDRRRGR